MSAANARHMPVIILIAAILLIWWLMWRESNQRYGTVLEPSPVYSPPEPPPLPVVEEDGPK